MTRVRFVHPLLIMSMAAAYSLSGCSSAEDPVGAPNPVGGSPNGSGGASGGPTAGGAATAGSATGGAPNGGAATAGAATGGMATAGAATAGAGGTATAGAGGTATAGAGGSATAGAGGTATAGAGGSATAGAGGTATAGAGGSAGGASGSSGGSGGSGGSGTGALSAGCGKAPTIAANMYNNGNPIPIMAANRQRRYILSVPPNYDNTKPYRLVIAWHQFDGNDKQMYAQNYYWLKDIPEAASSTIFVAPNGEKEGGAGPCTGTDNNGETRCGWPDADGSNVALGDAVVAQVTENFCIDKNKIFANGWSYGGSMSFRTACSRPHGGTEPWGVRAIAIYNGNPSLSAGSCRPSKPVPVYVSHGTTDTVFKHSVGVGMAETWAKLNSCTWMTPTTASGNHVCTNMMGCAPGYPVEFCSFVGPHTPDPKEGNQRWQPQEVWKFFSQF
jgi:poly(3-hydroxybutyrate) depolymerase